MRRSLKFICRALGPCCGAGNDSDRMIHGPCLVVPCRAPERVEQSVNMIEITLLLMQCCLVPVTFIVQGGHNSKAHVVSSIGAMRVSPTGCNAQSVV